MPAQAARCGELHAAPAGADLGSLMTRRWREMDSNPRSPRQRRHPSATANHLSSHHLPRKLGLRFAPKASTPSRKSSELRRRP
jgi:hypothetical protein